MQLINNEYVAPTYNVVLSSSDIDQGESFDATITTTNILPGTYLYYQLTDITANDVTDPSQRYGYVQIGADGTVTKENVATLTTGGTLTFRLYTDPGLTSENQVASAVDD